MPGLSQASRILSVALVSVLAGCETPPDYGFVFSFGGPYAVGSLVDVRVKNDCPIPRELPCDEHREVRIDSVTVDDPTVFSLEPADGEPGSSVALRALRAGSTQVHVSASRPGGAPETAHATLHAQTPTGLLITPVCSLEANPEVLFLPTGAMAAMKVYLAGEAGVLDGRDYLPVDMGALAIVEKDEHDLGAYFRVRAPEVPTSTAITTPLLPSFARKVEVYTLSQVDGLALEAPGSLRAGGYLSVYALSAVGGTRVCLDVSDRPGRVLVTVETPSICGLSADGTQAQATLPTKFTLYGLARGLCRVSAQFEGTSSSGSREFEVQAR